MVCLGTNVGESPKKTQVAAVLAKRKCPGPMVGDQVKLVSQLSPFGDSHCKDLLWRLWGQVLAGTIFVEWSTMIINHWVSCARTNISRSLSNQKYTLQWHSLYYQPPIALELPTFLFLQLCNSGFLAFKASPHMALDFVSGRTLRIPPWKLEISFRHWLRINLYLHHTW